jgi:hypothetical protein
VQAVTPITIVYGAGISKRAVKTNSIVTHLKSCWWILSSTRNVIGYMLWVHIFIEKKTFIHKIHILVTKTLAKRRRRKSTIEGEKKSLENRPDI